MLRDIAVEEPNVVMMQSVRSVCEGSGANTGANGLRFQWFQR